MTRSRNRTAALAGLGVFVGLVAVQHAFRADDLPPADHFISEYARGDAGWVQVVAFLAWAGSLGVTVALARGAGERRPVARGVVMAAIAVGAAGAVACAAFATQTVAGELPTGAVRTTAGQLHDLGSGLIAIGLIVAALASLRLVSDGSYRLSVLGLGLLLFAVPSLLVAFGYDAPGWGQRGLIAVACLWQLRFVLQSSSES